MTTKRKQNDPQTAKRAHHSWITKKELAERLGISPTTVNIWRARHREFMDRNSVRVQWGATRYRVYYRPRDVREIGKRFWKVPSSSTQQD